MSELVKEALGYLEPINVSFLATCVDDQPYVRAMMLVYHNNRIYFATGSTDKKVDQITRNSSVEVFIPIGENEGGLRLRGMMSFITNEDTRAEIHGCAGFIQGFWENPQDPDFVLMEFSPHKLELMRPGSIEIVRGSF
jgi:general stress protein 26